MTFDRLFTLANTYILPFWILMIFLPNWSITKKVMNYYWLFLPLIGLYIYYLSATFDPSLFTTLANSKLSDITAFFSVEGSAGAGWVHFLALDLFLGRWIYWQGQDKKIFTTHSLFLCLFFGPLGLLSHMVTVFVFYRDYELNQQDSKSFS